jgi:hypothetical protein
MMKKAAPNMGMDSLKKIQGVQEQAKKPATLPVARQGRRARESSDKPEL